MDYTQTEVVELLGDIDAKDFQNAVARGIFGAVPAPDAGGRRRYSLPEIMHFARLAGLMKLGVTPALVQRLAQPIRYACAPKRHDWIVVRQHREVGVLLHDDDDPLQNDEQCIWIGDGDYQAAICDEANLVQAFREAGNTAIVLHAAAIEAAVLQRARDMEARCANRA